MTYMNFHFLTLFPDMIHVYMNEAMLKRAAEKKLISYTATNVRTHSTDKHHKVDERPYGGGPGMVMTAEPFLRAFQSLAIPLRTNGALLAHTKVIMLSPSGIEFTNTIAKQMAKKYKHIVFICGRYEGVDDRVRQILQAEEYSIGDYVLTGGELPALVMTDAIARQIKGVLGDSDSLEEVRTASPRVFTRPETFVWPTEKKPGKRQKTYAVPEVLVQGDHKKIEAWRKHAHTKTKD